MEPTGLAVLRGERNRWGIRFSAILTEIRIPALRVLTGVKANQSHHLNGTELKIHMLCILRARSTARKRS